ncbi:unnamed protein product [Chrysoparadoxa australica]
MRSLGHTLLCCAAILGFSRGESASSRLQVQIPHELFEESGYPHQEALFGIPKYGGVIAERLLYGGGEGKLWQLCSDEDIVGFENPDPENPFVLLVDRGGCTFVSKVRRAQHLGAAGVLIADNKCLCSDAKCASIEICQALEPIMADDGSGSDITIPSFLMKKGDSDALKSHLEANRFVQVEMTWQLPSPDDRVEWSLWTSSLDPTAIAFKREFKEIALALGTHSFFEPFYVLYDGSRYGCTGSERTHCGNLCTNNGRYCMTDPDFDQNNGVSGSDVVRESLRQKCIWNTYGGPSAPKKDIGVGKPWWDYVNEFATNCRMDKFTDAGCISAAMKASGVDEQVVNKCISDSGGTEGDVDNTVLKHEMDEKATKTIVILPTVYVNNIVERGGISAAAVMTTICAGYESGTAPDICKCAGQGNSLGVTNCVETWGGKGFSGGGGISVPTVFLIVLGIVGSMTGAGWVYYKRTQENMRDQVRGILAEYMPLEDQDEGGGRAPFVRSGGDYKAPAKETQLV